MVLWITVLLSNIVCFQADSQINAIENLWSQADESELPSSLHIEYERWASDARLDQSSGERSDVNSSTRFWYIEDELWRLSTDESDSTLQYVDSGQHPKDKLWLLSDRQLRLAAGRELERSSRFSPMHPVGVQAHRWAMFTHGVLGAGSLNFELDAAPVVNGSEWVFTATSAEAGRSVRVRGRLNGTVPLVDEVSVFEVSSGALLGGTRNMDWFEEPLSSTGWASRGWERFDSSGEAVERFLLRTVARTTRSEVEPLARKPELDGVDPVRGEVTVMSFVNERPNEEETLLVREDGWESFEAGDVRPGSSKLRWAGVGLLALMGAVFLWFQKSQT